MTINFDLDELESEVRESIDEPWSLDPEAILELIALARKGQASDGILKLKQAIRRQLIERIEELELSVAAWKDNSNSWQERAEAYERAIRLALKESGDSIVRTIWAAKLEKALKKWS